MKPAAVWSLFAACVLLVALAMGWSTRAVLQVEEAELQARAQAALEENTRLALWRMDSVLTALLAQENGRPFFHYAPYFAADRPYSRAPDPGGALLASPLLRRTPPHVLLHFQVDSRDGVTSPQAPRGVDAARALAEHTAPADRLRLAEERLATLRALLGDDRRELLSRVNPRGPLPEPVLPAAPRVAAEQKAKGEREFQARQQTYQSNVAPVFQPPSVEATADGGILVPLWRGEALLLARRVRAGTILLQGCWLDWPGLRQELLASVRDLLPQARLLPADERTAADERRLATLPVRLEPGSLAPAPAAGMSPVRLSLLAAWAGLALAALSVGALLFGVLDLSERRRVFVSAVTHELRTPLTTFRLYTDMLAEGMVPSEEKRRDYVLRLQAEARRLGHLVENVLFYARVEQGRGGGVRERVDLAEFLADVGPRLDERAQRSGLTLQVAAQKGTAAQVDRGALEQVLVNLVDNSCRYASGPGPPRLELSLRREGEKAVLAFRDHGPGLSATDRKRLFRPFSKSDREAASTAPGVGLGLALSRRLARAQGGDLRLDESVKDGAGFLLTIPL